MFDVLMRNYIILDTETTGLDPVACDLLEICALRVINDEAVDNCSVLVKPRKPIPMRATSINGITNDMVASAEQLSPALDKIRKYIGSNIIVGHNIGFDMSFINQNTQQFLGLRCIDTKVLAKIILGEQFVGGFSQANLESYYKIDNHSKHRAFGDCMALYHIINALKNDFMSKQDSVSIDDLLKSLLTNNTKVKSNYNAVII